MLLKKNNGRWRDSKGNRIFDPTVNKENMAAYYEDLYKKKPIQHHPYHHKVEETMKGLTENYECGQPECAQSPTKTEIKEAIDGKKNGKATTDWRNEILKKGGNEMVEFLHPVITAFWNGSMEFRHNNQCVERKGSGIIKKPQRYYSF